MSKLRTHYDNLKVSRSAPDSLIRAAYKVLLQQYHPDKVEDAKKQEALRITKLIRESYDVLSDPIKRAEHDQWIKEQESGRHNEKPFYQTQENHASPQAPIENNSGCLWIIALVAFCVWAFSDDNESPSTEVKQEQFVTPPSSQSYEPIQEKIIEPPSPKNDIELLSSVKELSKQGQFEKTLTPHTKNTEQLSSTTEVTLAEQNELKRLSQNWIIAHLSKDIATFSDLYDDVVSFYGTKKDKNAALESKLKLFKKFPELQQQIYGDIQFEKQTDGTIKSSFIKRVKVNENQKITDYPAYLIFKKLNNAWKIAVESDLQTDRNIAKKRNSVDIPKNAIRGDFNGDGNLDYMWMIPPKLKEDDCEGGICENQIKFSDSSIPTIKIQTSIGGKLSNLGDLNNNGTDEVGLLSSWFTSCWQPYYVWTYKNGNWIYAVKPIDTHCYQWDEGIKPIEIDPAIEGNVIVRYSSFTNDEIEIKSKSVKTTK